MESCIQRSKPQWHLTQENDKIWPSISDACSLAIARKCAELAPARKANFLGQGGSRSSDFVGIDNFSTDESSEDSRGDTFHSLVSPFSQVVKFFEPDPSKIRSGDPGSKYREECRMPSFALISRKTMAILSQMSIHYSDV
jgi:hypothetical protein